MTRGSVHLEDPSATGAATDASGAQTLWLPLERGSRNGVSYHGTNPHRNVLVQALAELIVVDLLRNAPSDG